MTGKPQSHDIELPNSIEPDDYQVGYRRPPKASRFKPGQSGNPKGRKKKPATVGEQLGKILRQKITVTENGESKRLSRQEIMLTTLANKAAKGDLKAVAMLLDIQHSHQDHPSDTINPSLLSADSNEIIGAFLNRQQTGENHPAGETDTVEEKEYLGDSNDDAASSSRKVSVVSRGEADD